MKGEIDGEEIATAILNGLPSQIESIITKLDALGENSELFSLAIEESRLLQEEQRRTMREES